MVYHATVTALQWNEMWDEAKNHNTKQETSRHTSERETKCSKHKTQSIGDIGWERMLWKNDEYSLLSSLSSSSSSNRCNLPLGCRFLFIKLYPDPASLITTVVEEKSSVHRIRRLHNKIVQTQLKPQSSVCLKLTCLCCLVVAVWNCLYHIICVIPLASLWVALPTACVKQWKTRRGEWRQQGRRSEEGNKDFIKQEGAETSRRKGSGKRNNAHREKQWRRSARGKRGKKAAVDSRRVERDKESEWKQQERDNDRKARKCTEKRQQISWSILSYWLIS